jgi:MFS family permease
MISTMVTTTFLNLLGLCCLVGNHHAEGFVVPRNTPRNTRHLPLVTNPSLGLKMPKESEIDILSTTNLRLHSDPTRLQSKSDGSEEEIEDDTSSLWLWTLVLPLLSVYISNQWTRSSVYYLVNFSPDADPFKAMNLDIGFSEAQYGVLASVAFTTLFAVASLGAGIASDRYNRKVLTVVSAVGWSVAALGTSLSTTYTEVVLCRIAMGLACAFSTSTAYTLINQSVPKDRIAFATSLYGTGVAFGGALASLSILLDNQYGWQQTMQIISVVGFGSAVLSGVLLPDDSKTKALPEDGNEGENTIMLTNEERSPFLDDVTEAVSTTRVKWLYSGSFLRFCSGLCIGVWSASYFKAVFPENAADYAVAQASITAVAGSASGLLGGAAADWLSSNAEEDPIGKKLWIPVVGSMLAAPAWYFAVHSDQSFETAMAWLAVEYFVAECWFGPTISALQGTVGSKIGGTAQGLFTLTGAIANLAPTALGFLYAQAADVQASSELGDLLATGVCFGYISCAACFAMSARSPTDIVKPKEI